MGLLLWCKIQELLLASRLAFNDSDSGRKVYYQEVFREFWRARNPFHWLFPVKHLFFFVSSETLQLVYLLWYTFVQWNLAKHCIIIFFKNSTSYAKNIVAAQLRSTATACKKLSVFAATRTLQEKHINSSKRSHFGHGPNWVRRQTRTFSSNLWYQ